MDLRDGNHFFTYKKNDNGAAAERHISPRNTTTNLKHCGKLYYYMVNANLWLVVS